MQQHYRRRSTDRVIEQRSFLKRVIADMTPWRIIQAIGYGTLIVFIAGGMWTSLASYEKKIDSLELAQSATQDHISGIDEHMAKIDQNLTDLHDYFIPNKGSPAR